eukprot:1864984-Rhodomonas_salina.3
MSGTKPAYAPTRQELFSLFESLSLSSISHADLSGQPNSNAHTLFFSKLGPGISTVPDIVRCQTSVCATAGATR